MAYATFRFVFRWIFRIYVLFLTLHFVPSIYQATFPARAHNRGEMIDHGAEILQKVFEDLRVFHTRFDHLIKTLNQGLLQLMLTLKIWYKDISVAFAVIASVIVVGRLVVWVISKVHELVSEVCSATAQFLAESRDALEETLGWVGKLLWDGAEIKRSSHTDTYASFAESSDGSSKTWEVAERKRQRERDQAEKKRERAEKKREQAEREGEQAARQWEQEREQAERREAEERDLAEKRRQQERDQAERAREQAERMREQEREQAEEQAREAERQAERQAEEKKQAREAETKATGPLGSTALFRPGIGTSRRYELSGKGYKFSIGKESVDLVWNGEHTTIPSHGKPIMLRMHPDGFEVHRGDEILKFPEHSGRLKPKKGVEPETVYEELGRTIRISAP